MFEKVSEKISVIGVYDKGKFTPRKFKWNLREIPIEKLTLICNIKDGGTKKRMYSALANGSLYRLLFNRDSEVWTLDSIYNEG